jgi:hypothetical protein
VSFVFGVPLAKAKKLFMAQAFHVPIGKGKVVLAFVPYLREWGAVAPFK